MAMRLPCVTRKAAGLRCPLSGEVNLSEAPLVTAGITCFNARATIERAVASAATQDWLSLEIVVVDDASTDGSPDIVRRLAAQDPRIRLVVHEHNGGPAAARNSILATARGAFVAFFDDDDESLPDRIRKQVETLLAYEASSGVQLVACHAAGERRYANDYVKPLPAIGARPIVPHGPALADYLLFYRRLPSWSYGAGPGAGSQLARRETFAQLGGFDARLRRVEDVDFAIRLALAGGHFVGTKEPLFTQYATVGADKSPEANRDAEVALAQKHRAYLESVGRYHYASRWPLLRYWHFRRNYLRLMVEFAAIGLRNPFTATQHILATGPARLRHERRMQKGRGS